MSVPQHPDAIPPERDRTVETDGGRLHVHEWGDPNAPPIVLCHGMFDHGRGFDLLAPLLAEHFLVLSIDARGHGDSSWADSYLWPNDVYDIICVLADLGRPAHLVGHSKGGGQATDAAVTAPELVRQLVNIDGFGPPGDEGFRPMADAPESLAGRFGMFLDRRRSAHARSAWRPYASLEELASRRATQNPNLDPNWVRYFAHCGASEDEDGWRWKADPQIVAGGFGPFRPDWIGPGWQTLQAPMLAVIGSIPDEWGPLPEDLLAERLQHVPQLERATVEGAGHFVHMEKPRETADLLLSFLERGA